MIMLLSFLYSLKNPGTQLSQCIFVNLPTPLPMQLIEVRT